MKQYKISSFNRKAGALYQNNQIWQILCMHSRKFSKNDYLYCNCQN